MRGDHFPMAGYRGAHNGFECPVQADRLAEVRVEERTRVQRAVAIASALMYLRTTAQL